jgi:hypothetical protein
MHLNIKAKYVRTVDWRVIESPGFKGVPHRYADDFLNKV